MINYKKATLVIRIINFILSILILVSLYGTYQAMKEIEEIEENMKYMACDGYAYDQSIAPEFCK